MALNGMYIYYLYSKFEYSSIRFHCILAYCIYSLSVCGHKNKLLSMYRMKRNAVVFLNRKMDYHLFSKFYIIKIEFIESKSRGSYVDTNATVNLRIPLRRINIKHEIGIGVVSLFHS